MSTSRIYITGQKSVEISNSEIELMKNAQLRSPHVYVRCLSMVLNVVGTVLSKLFQYTAFSAFAAFLFLILFNEADAVAAVSSLRELSSSEIVDAARAFLRVSFIIASVTLVAVSMFNSTQFGIRDVFRDDMFSRLAEKLNIKAHQIESVVTDI